MTIGPEGEDHVCCPPFFEPAWEERYNFFGEDSRLTELVQAIKEEVALRIVELSSSSITPQVIAAAESFGVGDASLYDFGPGEPIQKFGDLVSKTTLAEAEQWAANMRAQLDQVRDNLKVETVRSEIGTFDPAGPKGGGDGDEISLNIMKSKNHSWMDAAMNPGSHHGAGYNDGGIAWEEWGPRVWQLPLPVSAGFIPALEVSGFQLQYSSDNDWYFKPYARLSFAVFERADPTRSTANVP